MGRRVINRHELRAQAEAAEAMGRSNSSSPASPSRPRFEPARKTRPQATPRMRVVWAVCDMGDRTVATFDYTARADADALALDLKARGKGNHFVRSIKQPIQPED